MQRNPAQHSPAQRKRAQSKPAQRIRAGCERGVITAMFAVLAIFLILLIGVVAEGGRKLSNLSRAEDLAAEAARAAAATLTSSDLSDGGFIIDTDRAKVEAEKIVGPILDAEIEDFLPTDDSVFVVVRVSGQSYILGLNIDGVGSHRAAAFNPGG